MSDFMDGVDLKSIMDKIGIGGANDSHTNSLGGYGVGDIKSIVNAGNTPGVASNYGESFNTMGSLPGLGGDQGGWLSGMFKDDGLFSKGNLSMGSDIVGMGTGIMGMYNSMQDRKMMEDMVKYGKDSANRDRANAAIDYNANSADVARARNTANAGTGRAQYIPQRIDGSAIN